jgi:alpha-beta hydrolase superfamily lysophospholipase
MKEKSRWFYTEQTHETKAVVLIVHGLNLHPKKMDVLAKFFTDHNCDVLRSALGDDPKRWEEKFENDYDKAREQSEILERPLYFVGYSLGALVGLAFLEAHPFHSVKKMALFAPAIHTKTFTKLSAALAFLFPKGSLPSLNLKEYRERNKTTLAEYKKMHELQRKIKSVNSFSLPTIVIASRKDELINHPKLEKFAGKNPLWKVEEISNSDSPLPKKYHHLMIDDMSLGRFQWEKILNILAAHFTL